MARLQSGKAHKVARLIKWLGESGKARLVAKLQLQGYSRKDNIVRCLQKDTSWTEASTLKWTSLTPNEYKALLKTVTFDVDFLSLYDFLHPFKG